MYPGVACVCKRCARRCPSVYPDFFFSVLLLLHLRYLHFCCCCCESVFELAASVFPRVPRGRRTPRCPRLAICHHAVFLKIMSEVFARSCITWAGSRCIKITSTCGRPPAEKRLGRSAAPTTDRSDRDSSTAHKTSGTLCARCKGRRSTCRWAHTCTNTQLPHISQSANRAAAATDRVLALPGETCQYL